MQPKDGMVPKECGFNQSETVYRLCVTRSPCLLTTERDPNSSYVTTNLPTERLHVDATIIMIFQKELFPRFLPSTCVGQVVLAPPGIDDAFQSERMATQLNSLFFVLKISLLPKYRLFIFIMIIL